MQTGTYLSGRIIDQESIAKTTLNRTGLVISRAEYKDENLTKTHSIDVAGK